MQVISRDNYDIDILAFGSPLVQIRRTIESETLVSEGNISAVSMCPSNS